MNEQTPKWLKTRDFAYWYADNSFNVFSVHTIENGICSCGNINCLKQGKHPFGQWTKTATIDKRRIDQIWNKDAKHCYNIGIATGKISGITVVDIDAGKGGIENWEKICAEYDIPDTFTVKSGGGGYHLYFKYTPNVKTKTDALAEGIDIRNDGGYIIAPPSSHASGNEYEVDGDIETNIQLADWPECLTEIANCSNTLKKKITNNGGEKITIKRAKKLLEYIDTNNYDTWLNVGIILGREFNRSDEAWELYNNWADKYDGRIDGSRNAKMREAFYETSQNENVNGKNLSSATLYKLAIDGGYKSGGKSIGVENLCYIAEENAFVYLVNGAKWNATAVDGMCPKVKNDEDEYVKPTQWLIENRPATCVINNSKIPTGYVKDYDVNAGIVYSVEGSAVVNLFSKSSIKPLDIFLKNEKKENTKLNKEYFGNNIKYHKAQKAQKLDGDAYVSKDKINEIWNDKSNITEVEKLPWE